MKKLWFAVFILTAFLAFGQSENSFDILQNKEGGITVTGYTGPQKEVVIPERFGGIPVTTIGKKAFAGKGLKKVTIPKTVTVIDEGAFYDNSLSEVLIPDGVQIIWNEAFSNNSLTSVALPNSLKNIGSSAFSRNKITSVTWPANVDFMRANVFKGNPVTTINLGGAANVPGTAFEGSDASSITIGKNVVIDGMSGLDNSFINFYNGNGKKAGTYVRNNRIWSVK